MSQTTTRILLTVVICAVALLGLQGCDKKERAPQSFLFVMTSPVAATVSIDNEKKSTLTPATLRVSPGTHLLKVEKLNYKPQWRHVICKSGGKLNIEVALKPITASVMINSKPSGAMVVFKGKEIGETPLSIHNLSIGSYTAQLKHQGTATVETQWRVENARPQRVSVNLASNIGVLEVDSTPSQASLFIDGEPHGNTPFSDTIEEGAHTIKIEKDGYLTYEQILTVIRDKTTSRTAMLEVLPVSLSIISNPPDSELFVNGKQYGNTPTEIKNLAPGEYQIILRKVGFDPVKRSITIAPGQREVLELNMDSNTGGIDLVVNPPGVTIYLDGKQVGISSSKGGSDKLANVFHIGGLSSEKHTLEVWHKRAVPERKKLVIKVQKNRTTRVKTINMWITDHILKLKKGGIVMLGRLVRKTDTSIFFEPEPGVKQEYQMSEIKALIPLGDKE